MDSHIKAYRSFRFWTILVPFVTTAVSLYLSLSFWTHILNSGYRGDAELFPSAIGFSLSLSVITVFISILSFLGNAWANEHDNWWTENPHTERIAEFFLVRGWLNWRLRPSVDRLLVITFYSSPIGLAVNLVGIGVAAIRAIIVLLAKLITFALSCRPI